MHELAITENIVRIVVEHARRANARKVHEIHLVVGDLTTFVPDSIQFYFDLLSEGTLCEGAQLVIERRPGQIRCRQCGETYPVEAGQMWICPHCGAFGGDVAAGRELYVDHIEAT
ncbi:MAG: hydrogenase maturation nickel metallochaperone HypA [Anaerolineae bacterium]